MDVGPHNVLGKRPSLVDPLVLELITKIEGLVAQPDVEIEGRIGTLTVDERNKRLHLPITTECLIDSSALTQTGRPLRYEFVPDLGTDSFEKIKNRLETLLSGKLTANPPNPLFKINSVRSTHTVDEIYKKPTQCRVSYDKSTYGMGAEPVEVIAKESVHKMDIFSGHYADIDEEATAEEEGQKRHPFDYRLSVNQEKKLDPSIVSSLNRSNCQMVREKQRTSFDMKAWTVDLTRVTVIHPANPNEADKFEVEVELKRELLAEQLDRRAKGKQHGAYQILNDFLNFLRDLAFVFGPRGSGDTTTRVFSGGYRYPELVSCEPSEDKRRKYKDVMGTDVMPIIGDYVFQILDEIRPPTHA